MAVQIAPPASLSSSPALIRRGLYLFAGVKRRSSIADKLAAEGWHIEEVDVLRSRSHDLTRQHLRDKLLQKIEAGRYGLLISSPPCNSFTRVKFNAFGPPPSRSKEFPRGLPWASPALKQINRLGNSLVDLSFQASLLQLKHAFPNGMLIKEHPEDLGIITSGKFKGKTPASIWQSDEHQKCVDLGALSVGLRQSDFGRKYAKPTRLLLRLHADLPSTFFPGLPFFSSDGRYAGPIPASTTHTETLAKQTSDEEFRTTGTSEWPPLLCDELVRMISVGKDQGVCKHETLHPTCDSEEEELLGEDSTFLEKDPVLLPASFGTVLPADEQKFVTNEPFPDYNRGGTGPPRSILSLGRVHNFHDGAGLCSPGRWEKQRRCFPVGKRWDNLREEIVNAVLEGNDEASLTKHLAGLFCGKEDLFDKSWPIKVRSIIHKWLSKQVGDYPCNPEPKPDEGQPFYLEMLFFLLREAKDPDFAACRLFQAGVNLGVTEPLQHNPAIFELQTKWRLKDDPLESGEWLNPNYPTVKEFEDEVRKQFEADKADGLMGSLPLADFRKTFSHGHAVSALSVIQEKDKLRVLHDGTHVTRVNFKMRTRDKLRNPGPREKALLLNGYRARKHIGASLLGDFSKAHRLVKICERDWGWMGCTIDGSEIYFNKVGTFGMGTAAYWWGRLGACLIRAIYILLGPKFSLDMLLFADDIEMIAEHKGERLSLLLATTVLFALGAPMKWKKFRGGYELDWIGYHFSHSLYAIGISASRAEWICLWIDQLLLIGLVSGTEFAGGLGRLNFTANALIYEKPFLGILYLWGSAILYANVAKARLPWACRIVLFWLARRLREENGRLLSASAISSVPFTGPRLELFRSDAKATDSGAWIGGWEYLGGQPCKSARWFAFQISENDFPWVFCKRDPKRVIAALELLATIVSIMLFGRKGTHTGTLSGSTDNQSNTFAVKRMMSTKFPLTILVMELSAQLRCRSASLDLDWLERSKNQPADDLTNNVFDRFSMELRVDVIPSELQFLVLREIQESSQILYLQLTKEKLEAKLARGSAGIQNSTKRKLANKERMKWTQPW